MKSKSTTAISNPRDAYTISNCNVFTSCLTCKWCQLLRVQAQRPPSRYHAYECVTICFVVWEERERRRRGKCSAKQVISSWYLFSSRPPTLPWVISTSTWVAVRAGRLISSRTSLAPFLWHVVIVIVIVAHDDMMFLLLHVMATEWS